MGSGKTKAARALGTLLNRSVIDLDNEITRLNGSTPAELITQLGEDAFRKIETEVLREVLDKGAEIIALGGGAWTVEQNRTALTARKTLVIWLNLPFDSCWKRISDSKGARPLAPDREQAKTLYNQRLPLYQLAALHIEATEEMEAMEVAERVVAAIQKLPHK
jgi:shikimate kinase